MSAIAKTVWLIESHKGTPITLDGMAEHAGVSRSHLSRIFSLSTGTSISSYLRGRLLSEAAKQLADGAPDILQVALEHGYGSHEAFTRAFRDQFGITPEQLRRRRSLDDLTLVEPLSMDSMTTTTLPPPTIEKKPAMRIAGLLDSFEMSNPDAIPSLWQRLGAYLGHIPGATSPAAYGVVTGTEGDRCDYMAGVEISPTAEPLPEFKVLQVPAQRWARYAHQGHISAIRSTIRAIYGGGLERDGLTQAEGLSFMEYYGPDFDPRTGLGTVEIWIGLKD